MGCRYLDSVESRLAALEHSVAGVTGRVSRIETSQADITPADSSRPQHKSPSRINGFDLHDEEGTNVDIHDPTDGIGSISFTKEEESGYFGSPLHF